MFKNSPTVASGRDTAGEVSFLLRVKVDSVAFYFLIHVFSESRKNWRDVTVHTGGRCSPVCFLPAGVAAAVHAAS